MIIQHRRGTIADWKKADEAAAKLPLKEAQEKDLIPKDGELFIVEEANGTYVYKIGDGKTPSSSLPYIDSRAEKSLTAKIAATKTAILDQIENIESSQAGLLSDAYKSLSQQITKKNAELADAFVKADQEVLEETTQLITSKVTTLQSKLSANYESISRAQTQLEAQLAEISSNLSSDTLAVKDLLDKKIASFATKIESLRDELSDIEETINSDLKAFTSYTSTKIKDHANDLKQLKADNEACQADSAELFDKLDSVNSRIDALLVQYGDNLLTIKLELESFKNTLESISNNGPEQAADLIKDKATELTELFNGQLTELEKTIVAYVKEVSDDYSKSLQEATSSLQLQLDIHKGAQQKALEALDNRLKAEDAKLLETLNSLQAQYAINKQSVASTLSQLESQLSNSSNTWLANWDSLQETISQLSEELSEDLADQEEQHRSDIAKIDDDLNSLSESQQTANNAILESLQEYVTQIYIELSRLLGDDISLLDKINVLEEQLANDIAATELSFDTKLSDTKESLESALATTKEDLEQELAETNLAVTRGFESASADLAAAVESLSQSQVAQADAIVAELNNNIDILDLRIRQIKSQLDADLADQIASVSENITAVETALTDKIETYNSNTNLNFFSTNNVVAELKRSLADAKVDFNDQISAARATINANQNRTNEALDLLDEEIQNTNNKLEDVNVDLYVQSKRIDRVVSVPKNDTEGNAELLDIREGYNGIAHESAGAAVRAIGKDLDALKKSLPSYIPANSVDGLYYEDNLLYLTSSGSLISEPVEITGGGGGDSISTVRVKNNAPSATFTIAKGKDAIIDFTYTSFENEVPTGAGTCTITINSKKISEISGTIQHGVAKSINVAKYLRNGSNTVRVVCSDQYGSTRSLTYNISVIELSLDSSFDSTKHYTDSILFRYTAIGKVEKTVHILLDGKEIENYPKTFGADVSGNEITIVLPKQAHGSHKIVAYMEATIGTDFVRSNELCYEIICLDEANKEYSHAILASVYSTTEVNQGTMLAIPYQVYDPRTSSATVDLTVYAHVGGTDIEYSKTTATVEHGRYYWNVSQYPTGQAIFKISYTYTLLGTTYTLERRHTVNVITVDTGKTPESDGLQLHLNSVNRSNDNITERNQWTFGPDDNKITTSFTNFNWKTNGWVNDNIVDGIGIGDTCLRLNGEARAEIAFKPFDVDFKELGKTIEIEFAVRDVNKRNAVIIDCYDGKKGIQVTPDTIFLKSSVTSISSNFKEDERIRVSITVESVANKTQFISIYLDGVLSGVKRYSSEDDFAQTNPLNIKLGSSYCGVDIYSIRVYNKALSGAQILDNFIADQANPTTVLDLATDNDILYTVDDGADLAGQVSYEKVRDLGKIPIITFTGTMPTYKGDKKKDSVYMTFEDPAHPELSFTDVLLKEIDVQGTSSADYVRKNWKLKFYDKITHMPGAMPAKVYCIKVDYAEATGTHNTGTANFVEDLYYRSEATIPPQKDDPRVRTTIQGFPCIIFEKATPESTPVFSSKGNFNYDKGAEDVFGFNEDYYASHGVECWEFCNNISQSVNFLGPIPDDWRDDFEPRYSPESYNFDKIEELVAADERAKNGNGIFTDAQKAELASYQKHCIANFKEVHDWVLSTATQNLDGSARVLDNDAAVEDLPEADRPSHLLKSPITYNGVTYRYDTKEYRLAKFKAEFTDHFNLHYSTMYYVFTSFALMVDQRAKNLFLTRWKDDDGVYRWYPYFYDNDTIFGINNVGVLSFDYFHEDIDQIEAANVYNGQNSALWNNFRLCFGDKIEELYAKLRTDKKLTYDKLVDQYITKGSDKWSAAIYNADAEYKYVSLARPDAAGKYDATHLIRVRGPAEHHLKYFIANRLSYLDGKWYAGDYPNDRIVLRLYTPTTADVPVYDNPTPAQQAEIDAIIASNERITASQNAVRASADITITPYSNMYAGVRYASGTLLQKRLAAGEEYTFTTPTVVETNDTETSVYGASSISSLGDLSNLYCDHIDLSAAEKLIDLKLGNANPDYHNDNIKVLALGSNRLLKKLDIRNCSGLGVAGGDNVQHTLDLKGCQNIETILATGTSLQSLELVDGGYIETLRLPETINTLIIKNHPNLYMTEDAIGDVEGETGLKKGFYIESYANLDTLNLENCTNLSSLAMINRCRPNPTPYLPVTDPESENYGKFISPAPGSADYGKFTLTHLRLKGFDWHFDNADFLKELIPVREDGILVKGLLDVVSSNVSATTETPAAYLSGKCYIRSLTGEDYALLKRNFPDLEISFGELTSNIYFRYKDSAKVTHEHVVEVTCTNSTPGEIPLEALPVFTEETKPYWDENDAFTYKFLGDCAEYGPTKCWTVLEPPENSSVTDNEDDYLEYSDALNGSSLTGILGDRVLYPVFKPERKKYLVTFINSTNAYNDFLYSVEVPYGGNAEYAGRTPIRGDVAASSIFEHVGWEPKPENITGERRCDAQFALIKDAWYTLTLADLYDTTTGQYGLRTVGDGGNIQITKNYNNLNAAVKIPEKLNFDSYGAYTIVGVGGFINNTKVALVSLPETVTEILTTAFSSCSALFEISLPSGLLKIGSQAFKGSNLKTIHIPALVKEIGEAAFADCPLEELTVDETNQNFFMHDNCLIAKNGNVLLRGLSSININITNDPNTVAALGPYCFASTKVKELNIPDHITIIPSNAFSHCYSLETVRLPASLNTLDATCFGWSSKLRHIDLPEGLRYIKTYVFYLSGLDELVIPSTVEEISEYAFGNISNLRKVTFMKSTIDGTAEGPVKVPKINSKAFSGCKNIEFNVPWTEAEAEQAAIEGNYVYAPGYGASSFTINEQSSACDKEDQNV